MKASTALKKGRAMVREPFTAFWCLAMAAGADSELALASSPGYQMLDWVADQLWTSHATVEGQLASYDVAISMALSDEAGE